MTRRQIAKAMLLATTALSACASVVLQKRLPNIITIVLDDVGYSDIGCFGSEIRTPALDSLAADGLRYLHFDTKAVCAPTRASMLTGRNSHSVNMPDVPDVAAFAPNDPVVAQMFRIPDNAENVAQVLKRQGYATWALGKWHLIPMHELDESSDQSSWPCQRGFDYFYGFARGWTDQYRPELVENNAYLSREDFPEDYHLSSDLVDKAIEKIRANVEGGDARPFYMNLAFGAAHAPIQVPREYSAPYDSIYARGWDEIREARFERMKRDGVVPENTLLPPRAPADRAWADLSEDEQVVFARYMAVYAGFVAHCDHQIGRLLETLETLGLRDDTLIVFLSDNGPASEAGQEGDFEHLYRPNTLSPAEQRARIDEIGTAATQAEYPRPWAYAGATPLRRYKLWPHAGGARTPMIVSWPGKVSDPGAMRRQFVDVIDIAPTLLEAAGTQFAPVVAGVEQIPVAGRSILATFADPDAPARRTQYFEFRGNRAVTDGRWRALTVHPCGVAYEDDDWELFDLEADFSEATNLAAANPGKLSEMKALWDSEWARYGTGPLSNNALICATRPYFDLPASAP